MDIRLQTILEMMPPSNVLYDIGTDHAYLPIAAVLNERVSKAYAVDNKEGPLNQASLSVQKQGLSEKVFPVLSDGINALKEECDLITISGLGGKLIFDILNQAPLTHVNTLILQANNHVELVRKLTASTPFKITEEKVIKQKEEIYVIIKMEKGSQTLDETDLYIGPLLRKNPPNIYIESLQKEYLFLEELINKIPHELAKEPLKKKRNLLEGIFNEWRNH